MSVYSLTKERQGLENALLNHSLDFSGTYMMVTDLYHTIKATPGDVKTTTIQALKKVLESGRHASQKKSLFLYRQAANCLIHIPLYSGRTSFSHQALSALETIVLNGKDTRHRAVSEALGRLPVVEKHSFKACKPSPSHPPSVDWNDIRMLGSFPTDGTPEILGRSVILEDKKQNILTIKLARSAADHDLLRMEAAWMIHLGRMKEQFQKRFNIPVPVPFQNHYLFKLHNIPPRLNHRLPVPFPACGIAFWAGRDYYEYPNDNDTAKRCSASSFLRLMDQNAWLLGNLTRSGIIHTAPIPLFHNRIQRHRRTDQGVYLWPMGGRLDRWLTSSQFPNIGVSGIRDFEHMIPFSGSPNQLYETIGTQILSLILIIGSYFRNRDPGRFGLDPSGKPVDVRHLFDPDLFSDLLQTIFLSYFEGFTDTVFQGELPFCSRTITHCLIEEMGVDRYMEEILRFHDIQTMDDDRLSRFLTERGVQADDLHQIRTSRKDVVLHTGPHLGGFNQRISIPELIPFLETVSAICILGKFLQMK